MARLIDSGPGCPTPTPLRGASAAEARGLAYDDAVKAETDATGSIATATETMAAMLVGRRWNFMVVSFDESLFRLV